MTMVWLEEVQENTAQGIGLKTAVDMATGVNELAELAQNMDARVRTQIGKTKKGDGCMIASRTNVLMTLQSAERRVGLRELGLFLVRRDRVRLVRSGRLEQRQRERRLQQQLRRVTPADGPVTRDERTAVASGRRFSCLRRTAAQTRLGSRSIRDPVSSPAFKRAEFEVRHV